MAADVVSILVIGALAPVILISYLNRNKLGAGIVCSNCGVELRGWHSSGRKQIWTRTNSAGGTIYYCARCKDK